MNTQKIISLVEKTGISSDYYLLNGEGQIAVQKLSWEPRGQEMALWTWNIFNAVDDYFPKSNVICLSYQDRQLVLLRLRSLILGVFLPPDSDTVDLTNRLISQYNVEVTADPALGQRLALVRQSALVAKPAPTPVQAAPVPVETASKSNEVNPNTQSRSSGKVLGALIFLSLAIAAAIFFVWSRNQSVESSLIAATVPVQQSRVVPPPETAVDVPVSESPHHAATALEMKLVSEQVVQMAAMLGIKEHAVDESALAELHLLQAEQHQANDSHEMAAHAWESVADISARGGVKAARVRFDNAVEDFSLSNLDQYPSTQWREAGQLWENAEIALKDGQWIEAMQLAENSLGRVESIREELTNVLLTKAVEHEQRNDFRMARFYFGELFKLQPESSEASRFLYRHAFPPGHIITNSIGLTMAYIPPGTYTRGTPLGEANRDDDETQHAVILSRGFFLGVHEVTQEQWDKVMGNSRAKIEQSTRGRGAAISPNLPMYGITWQDAVEFCQRLSLLEQKSYRLPTEAEWEYACRAGTTGSFNNGTNRLTSREANVTDAFSALDAPVAVGVSGPANAWGLFDMHGNLWEWCADWYAPYPEESVVDPIGPDDDQIGRIDLATKTLRGGSWYDEPDKARSGNRWGYLPSVTNSYTGFRIVLEVTQFDEAL